MQAELMIFYALEEYFQKQKTGIQLFKYENRNTKFSHAHINGKRKGLQLKRIQNASRVWFEREKDMVHEAIRFFQDQFIEENSYQFQYFGTYFTHDYNGAE